MSEKSVNEYVGLRIRQIRDEIGLSQQELAAELGWQQTKLSRMERGITPITVEELGQLSQALGKTFSYFFPRSDTEELTQSEQQLLDLFRQLDGNMRRLAVLQFIVELRDEEEQFAQNVLIWKPERISPKYDQLRRWLGSEAARALPVLEESKGITAPDMSHSRSSQPFSADNAAQEHLRQPPEWRKQHESATKDLAHPQRAGNETNSSVPYWHPYSEELEYLAFRELAAKIEEDLDYAYNHNQWDKFDCDSYRLAIKEIRQFKGR